MICDTQVINIQRIKTRKKITQFHIIHMRAECAKNNCLSVNYLFITFNNVCE